MNSKIFIKNSDIGNYSFKIRYLKMLIFHYIKNPLQAIPSWYFLSLGLFFSTATKLRLPNLPLGLSDVFFLLFAVTAYIRNEFIWHTRKYLRYIGILIFCLILSDFFAIYNRFENNSLYMFYYDNISLLYVFLFSWLLLIYKKDLDIVLKVVIISTLVIGSIAYLLYNLDQSSFKYFYYKKFRFSFLSVNPNQLALLLVPFPFFIIHFYRFSLGLSSSFWNKWSFLLIFITICYGAVVYSAAIFFSWIIVIIITFSFYLRNISIMKNISNFFWYFCLFIFFVLLIISIIYIYLYINITIKTKLISIISELYIRFDIWNTLIEELIKKWFIIGYGTGAIVKLNGINFEPHNTLLSIAFSGGVFLFFGALYALYIIGIRAYYRGYFLLMAHISIILFTMFHNSLRMPTLWFYFVYLFKKEVVQTK